MTSPAEVPCVFVLPRTPGDGFRIKAAWHRPGRRDLDLAAGQVRQGLRALSG